MRRRSHSGTLTVKPDTLDGHFAILDENGDAVGAGIARPSSVVGYVTLVVLKSERPLGSALRVPADWIAELGRVRE